MRLHLGPMVAVGTLVYTIPEMLNHPGQKYTLPSKSQQSDIVKALDQSSQ